MTSPYLDQPILSLEDRAAKIAGCHIRRARKVLKTAHPDRDITISVVVESEDRLERIERHGGPQ